MSETQQDQWVWRPILGQTKQDQGVFRPILGQIQLDQGFWWPNLGQNQGFWRLIIGQIQPKDMDQNIKLGKNLLNDKTRSKSQKSLM